MKNEEQYINYSFILAVYFLIIVVLIFIYIYADSNRKLITGVVSILSGSTIALGLLNYMSNENTKQIQDAYNAKRDYIDFIGNSFDKIDSYYLENPNELNELYYEFYGYSNFPVRNIKENQNQNQNQRSDSNSLTEDKRKVTDIEYIVLLKIIQQINIMFITNEKIFEDINFRNKLINFTRSTKFKEVLSFNKNNFASEFIEKLNKLKIITDEEIQVEQITIPKINYS